MKNGFLICLMLALFIPCSTLAKNITSFSNRIEGQVYSPDRVPVENAFVELINDVDSMIAQTRTNSGGRFTFIGMPGGRYIVKVSPFGTNFKEQTQEVYVLNPTRGSNDIAYVDVYLTYNKRSTDKQEAQTAPEAVFVQEIPISAKKLYQEGADDLEKNPDKALSEIEEALGIFPDYFDALNLLGREYFNRQNYEKAYPFLLRAIDINPRSSNCFYRLSYAFYSLRQYPAALKAAEATIILAPNSIDAQLLYGTVLRLNEKFTESEKALLSANSLAKGTNSEIHWQLALLYNRLNQNQSAIDELESFLKLEPNSPEKTKIRNLIAKLKSSLNSVNTVNSKKAAN